eukprot:296509-Rhodomonas_salina.1
MSIGRRIRSCHVASGCTSPHKMCCNDTLCPTFAVHGPTRDARNSTGFSFAVLPEAFLTHAYRVGGWAGRIIGSERGDAEGDQYRSVAVGAAGADEGDGGGRAGWHRPDGVAEAQKPRGGWSTACSGRLGSWRRSSRRTPRTRERRTRRSRSTRLSGT